MARLRLSDPARLRAPWQSFGLRTGSMWGLKKVKQRNATTRILKQWVRLECNASGLYNACELWENASRLKNNASTSSLTKTTVCQRIARELHYFATTAINRPCLVYQYAVSCVSLVLSCIGTRFLCSRTSSGRNGIVSIVESRRGCQHSLAN